MATAELHRVSIHGHEVSYRMGGEGPVVLLIHGMAGSSRTWKDVMPILAEDHTVLAPDLLGHGESAKPMGDYSLGAFASGLRDLMGVLGVERAPSSASRSAAASPCSSPTSTPSWPSASCSCARVGWGVT
jgi:pimeloyl-ACP methyl ester carboxylesterase